MRRSLYPLASVGAVSLGLLVAGCGGSGSPAAPSTTSPAVTTSSSAAASTQSLVTAAVSGASALALTGTGGMNTPVQSACPNGGSVTFTFSNPSTLNGSTMTVNGRMEFNNCQSQGVTIQGDPYLQMSGTYSMPVSSGSATTASASQHMAGALRFTADGEQGRAQYDCSYAMTIQMGSGAPQVSMVATGTMAWEQPLGSTPVMRSCAAE